MTSATDEVQRLLRERGVEHRDMQTRGLWFGITGHDHKYEAHEQTNGLISIEAFDLTPEQAIAVTLGSMSATVDDVLSLLDEMNEQGRIEYADYSQLHDAIAVTLGGNPSAAIESLRQTVRDAFGGESVSILVEGNAIMRAIDEVETATLGGGECEWVLREKWPNRTGDDHVFGYETSCGARHTWWPDSLPNFCPTCGNEVKAVKR